MKHPKILCLVFKKTALVAAQPQTGKLKRHLCAVDEEWWFHQLTEREPDLALSAYISNSVAVLAEIPLRSPQKQIIFIINNNTKFGSKYPKIK